MEEKKKRGGKLKWIIIVIIVLGIISAVGGNSEDKGKAKKVGSVNTADNKQDTAGEQNTNNKFRAGDIVQTDVLKITYIAVSDYTEYSEYFQPKDGYKYIKADFEIENVGNRDEFVGSHKFKCYADGYDMDEKLMKDYWSSADLSPGKKTQGSVYYEVPVNAKDVTLEYETNYFTQDKIIFVVSE